MSYLNLPRSLYDLVIAGDLADDYQRLVDVVLTLAEVEVVDRQTNERRYSEKRPTREHLEEVARFKKLPASALLTSFGYTGYDIDYDGCTLTQAIRHQFGQLESWPHIKGYC